jgi:malonate-semialdehyde dehydrogenase (acetylating)/methylmalonate-semialdehyde dehydrogenase
MSQLQLPPERLTAPHFIGGEFEFDSKTKFDIFSPWFGQVVGESYEADAKSVDRAIHLSEKAFQSWSQTPIKERTQVMFKFREILMRDMNMISQVISLESGKLISEAKAGLLKGIEVLEYAISLQNTDPGGKMEVSRGVFCEYRREPLGVVASITPFNFPAMVPLWTMPIALTLGNAFVWKPSEKTPLTSRLLALAFKEAGLPAGVLTILQGHRTTSEFIIDHPHVRAISFVGSTKGARSVYQRGTQLGKRVLALGGAKNHIFLMPDADTELTGKGIADSFTGCAGQRCMAASVLLPIQNPASQIDKIVAVASKVQLGMDMGAIISKDQLEFLKNAIDRAERSGAKILLDGRKAKAPQGHEGGYWLGPTVLDHVEPDSEAAGLELFGPILSIVRTKSLKDALDVENKNPYGNAASVFTNTGGVADYIAAHAKSAMIGINIGVPVPREPFSFGGMNESKFGHGDITGDNSLSFWTNMKKVTTKWQNQNDGTWMS